MIAALLTSGARSTPEAPFLVTFEGTYTYARTHDLVLRMAGRLAAAGIGPGDHVALIADNSAAWVIAFLGVTAAGGVAVTLTTALRGEDIDYLIAQCDARLIIADRAWIDDAAGGLGAGPAGLPRIVLESDESFAAELDSFEPVAAVPRQSGDPCAILYTSGTTGLPKGVVCAHGGHVAVGHQTARLLNLTAEDRIFVYLPLFHTNPQMYALMSALVTGASLGLRPRFSASRFFDDARRLGATGCTFVGTVLAILVARIATPQRDHALRFCIGGGTTPELAATVAERFGMHVHELYGMTEIGGWATGASRSDHRPGSNGRVRDDMDICILDDTDRPVPVGTPGQIAVRPRQPDVLMQGYYRKPEETLAALSNLWFHTGDIGRLDADGYLYFMGRTRELIRRGGEMISPVMIEERVRRLQEVHDCAVVGILDPIMGEEIKLVVVLAPDATASALTDSLSSRLRPTLPRAMWPRYLEIAPAIPRTQTEKVLRHTLAYLGEGVVDLSLAVKPSPKDPMP